MISLGQITANPQTLGKAATAVLSLAAVLWLGHNAWRDVQLGQTKTRLAPSAPSHSNPPATSVETLVAGNLFGVNGSTLQAAVTTESVPETRLKLELRGTFASTMEDESRALIAEKGKSSNYYKLFDQLPGGASLERIEAGRVMLKRNGRLETLSFSQTPDSRSRLAENSPPPLSPKQSEIAEAAAQEQQQTASIKERLNQLREARDL